MERFADISALLHVAFDSSDEAVAAVDRDDRIFYCNEAAAQLCECDVADLLERPIRSVLLTDWDRPGERHAAGAALESNGSWRGQHWLIRRSGQRVPVETAVSVLEGQDGNLLGALIRVHVVTEHLEALQREREARRLAERTASRLMRLQSVTAGLAAAVTVGEVASTILDQGVGALGADGGVVLLLSEDGLSLRLIDARGFPREQMERWQHLSLTVSTPIVDAVRRREAIRIGSSEERAARYPEWADMLLGPTREAWLAVPLLIGDRVLGALGFGFDEPKQIADEDSEFIRSLAQQCALAMERARLFDVERTARSAITIVAQERQVLIDSVMEGVFGVDADGNCTSVNQPALEILGYSVEECLGRKVHNLVHYKRPDGSPYPIEECPHYAAIWTGKGTHTVEDVFWRKDGTALPVLASFIPILDGGRVVGAVETFVDLTERIRAERALRESEERFRILAESLPQIVWTAEPTGKVDYYNQRWWEYCGVPPEQGEGWKWRSVIHPDERLATLRLWRASIETGEQYEVEHRIRRADGEYRWFLSRALPLRDAERRIAKWFGTSTEIHERKIAEETQSFLADASAVLAASLDAESTLTEVGRLVVPGLADAYLVDLISDDRIRTVAAVHVDPDRERALWDATNQVNGKREAFNGILASVLEAGRPYRLHVTSRARLEAFTPDDGYRKQIQATGARWLAIVPMSTHGRVIGTITLGLDPGGRRFSKHDLVVAEELARRMAMAVENARLYDLARRAIGARDEFISVAAHELKTPVTSLRGFAQMVLRDLTAQRQVPPDRLRRALEVIDLQSNKLSALVAQLLDVSRLESGRLILQRSRVRLDELIQGFITSLQSAHTGHRIVFVPAGPVEAMVDPLRMEQVIANLVDNAVKFSPPGSQVTIEVGSASPGVAQIAVTDQGEGIPVAERQRVFERFFQGGYRRHTPGLGLGLYVCRQIVELHGGRIRVEAPVTGGSRFVIELPSDGLEPSAENAPSAQQGQATPSWRS